MVSQTQMRAQNRIANPERERLAIYQTMTWGFPL